jgi:hypothetical protein
VEDDFGVAMGVERVAEGFELLANLDVVVDFAIKDDDVVVIVGVDGLIAAGEVNNFEAGRAEAAAEGLVDALLIGAAMEQRVSCPGDALWTGIPTFGCESDYAAQILSASDELPQSIEKGGVSLFMVARGCGRFGRAEGAPELLVTQ